MRQQNAGAISIQFGTLQQRTEKLRVMYSCVIHADELQSVDFHLFVIQNPDAPGGSCSRRWGRGAISQARKALGPAI